MNDDFRAIFSAKQLQLQFLQDIVVWINKWEILSKGNLYNGLSYRTFEAIKST